jgi:flagellar FliJ protein
VRKFQFKLQTLLDQRKSKENLLQAQLAELLREESQEKACLRKLQIELKHAWQFFDKLTESGDSSAGAFEICDTWAKALRDDIKVQILTIEAIKKRLDEKRDEVAEAMKQRKLIEALRDRKEIEYIAEQARIEQSTLDEIASLAYARRM